jgi:hypothetical protein
MERVKLSKNTILHRHYQLEEACNVPSGHVIIDEDAYFWLLHFHSQFTKFFNKLQEEVKDEF